MKAVRSIVAVAVLMAMTLSSSGCNALTTAQNFENVINGILQIAKAEIPALATADAAVLQQWVNLGTTLNGQLQTCIAGAGAAGGKKSAFLACFNALAAGVASPAELAQLRVLSSDAQKKAQLWVTAIILGVNAALAAFGGQQQTLPQVAAEQPSHQDLDALAHRLGVASARGF